MKRKSTNNVPGAPAAAPNYAARATAYAAAVVAGRVPACKLTKLACRRHLNDLKRSARRLDDFPYDFDAAAANRVCGFVEMFPHVKGVWARAHERLRLGDWQCFILASAFGWLERGTGLRRFRTIYIEVPRKNAKTTLSAPVALYMLTADGEQGAEVVAAATKRDQAKIVFNIARSMTRKCDGFRTEFAVMPREHKIICLETDSTFEAIDSKGSTQDGANLHLSVNDELHAWKGRALYAVLETALGSRTQPMMWNITTAGGDQSGICYEKRQYLEKVLQGIFRDDSLFGIVYSIDTGDDIYAEKTWRKANPNYGVSVIPRDIRVLAHAARQNPKSRNDFRMKRLNVWVNAATAYFDMDAWAACADPSLRAERFDQESCIVSLDLASKRDINAAVRLFERGDLFCVKADFWLPEAAVRNGACASYPGWVEEGWIRKTAGDVVDYEAIKDVILDDYAGDHVVEEVAYDPHQAMHLVRLLMDANLTCVEVRPSVLNFSEPMKELDRLMARREIVHDGNPALAWMLSNVVAVSDRKDNVYPRKLRDENKIDGAVALIAAVARALGTGAAKAPDIGALIAAGRAVL